MKSPRNGPPKKIGATFEEICHLFFLDSCFNFRILRKDCFMKEFFCKGESFSFFGDCDIDELTFAIIYNVMVTNNGLLVRASH